MILSITKNEITILKIDISNENQNKMVRRHYPKGISLDKVTPADTRKLEKWINDYPRGIFDYYSSADIYEACINSILAA